MSALPSNDTESWLLNVHDLRSFMNSTGRKTSLAQAQKLLDQYDTDGDGTLTFNQLLNALKKEEAPALPKKRKPKINTMANINYAKKRKKKRSLSPLQKMRRKTKPTKQPEDTSSSIESGKNVVRVVAVKTATKLRGRLQLSIRINSGVLKRRMWIRFITNKGMEEEVIGKVEVIKSGGFGHDSRNVPTGKTGEIVIIILKEIEFPPGGSRAIKKGDVGESIIRSPVVRERRKPALVSPRAKPKSKSPRQKNIESPKRNNSHSPRASSLDDSTISSIGSTRRSMITQWRKLEIEFSKTLRSKQQVENMWSEMDYKNIGEVTLAECDFLLSQKYKLLDNASALMMAYKLICPSRANTEGEHAIVLRSEFLPLMRLIFYMNRLWTVVYDPEEIPSLTRRDIVKVLRELNMQSFCPKSNIPALYGKLGCSYSSFAEWVGLRRMHLRELNEQQIIPPSGVVSSENFNQAEVEEDMSSLREQLGSKADTAAIGVQALYRGQHGRRVANMEKSARTLQAAARGRRDRKRVENIIIKKERSRFQRELELKEKERRKRLRERIAIRIEKDSQKVLPKKERSNLPPASKSKIVKQKKNRVVKRPNKTVSISTSKKTTQQKNSQSRRKGKQDEVGVEEIEGAAKLQAMFRGRAARRDSKLFKEGIVELAVIQSSRMPRNGIVSVKVKILKGIIRSTDNTRITFSPCGIIAVVTDIYRVYDRKSSKKVTENEHLDLARTGSTVILELDGLEALDVISVGNIGYSMLTETARMDIKHSLAKAEDVDEKGVSKKDRMRMLMAVMRLQSNYRARHARKLMMMGLKPRKSGNFDPKSVPSDTIANLASTVIQRWFRGYTVRCHLINSIHKGVYCAKSLRVIFYQMVSIRNNKNDPADMLVRVETGTCKAGMELIFQPSGMSGKISNMCEVLPPNGTTEGMDPLPRKGSRIESGFPGDLVIIEIKNVKMEKQFIHTGDVGGDVKDPPQLTRRMMANLVVSDGSITVGKRVRVTSHRAQTVCEIEGIICRQDLFINGGAPKALHARYGTRGQILMVVLVPCRDAVYERYHECAPLGQISVTGVDTNVIGNLRSFGTIVELQNFLDPIPQWAEAFKDNLSASAAKRADIAKSQIRIAQAEHQYKELESAEFTIVVTIEPGSMGVQLKPVHKDTRIGACVKMFPDEETSQLALAGIQEGMILQMIERIDVLDMNFHDIMLLLKARSKMRNKLTFLTDNASFYLKAVKMASLSSQKNASNANDGAFSVAVNISGSSLGAKFRENFNGRGAVIQTLIKVRGECGQLEKRGIKEGMWLKSIDGKNLEDLPFSDIETFLRQSKPIGSNTRRFIFGTSDSDDAMEVARRKLKMQDSLAKQRRKQLAEKKIRQIESKQNTSKFARGKKTPSKSVALNITLQTSPGPLGASFAPIRDNIGAVVDTLYDISRGRPSQLESQDVRIGMILESINGDNVKQKTLKFIRRQLRDLSSSRIVLKFCAPQTEKNEAKQRKGVRGNATRTTNSKFKPKNLLKPHIGDSLRLIIVGANGLPQALPGFTDPTDETQITFGQIVAGEKGDSWAQKVKASQSIDGRMCDIPKKRNKRNPTWKQSRWISTSGLKNPEVTVRIIDASPAGKTSIIGEVAFPVRRVRSSDGIQNVKIRDIYGDTVQDYGTVSYLWERTMEIEVDPTKIPSGLPKLEYVTLELEPGPMGCKLQKGFMGIGVRLVAFLLVRGKSGPIESSNVKHGMYLISSNGVDVSSMLYSEATAVLKRQAKRTRTMVWSTRPSDAALIKGVAKSFEFDESKAARRIQRVYRLRKEEGYFEEARIRERQGKNYRPKPKTRKPTPGVKPKLIKKKKMELPKKSKIIQKFEEFDVRDIRVTIIGGSSFAEGGRSWRPSAQQSSRLTGIQLVLGNDQETYSEKIKLSKEIPQCVKSSDVIENVGGYPEWNSAFWFRPFEGLEDPNVTLRVIDIDNRGKEKVVGECHVRLGPERHSGGIKQVKLRGVGKYQDKKRGSISMMWEITSAKKIDNEIKPKITDPYESKTIEIGAGPLGCQLFPGYGGLGCRVGAFMLVEGKEGQVERAGVKFGWYLEELNGDKQIGMLSRDEVLERFKALSKLPKRLKFASRPTEECLKFTTIRAFSLSPERAAQKIQQIIKKYVKRRKEGQLEAARLEREMEKQREKLADMKLPEWKRGIKNGDVKLGGDLKVVVMGGTYMPKGKRFGEKRESYVVLLVGEEGHNWSMKQKALALLNSKSKSKAKRFRRLHSGHKKKVVKTSDPLWGPENVAWLRLDNIVTPEVTIRVMDDMGIKDDGSPMPPVVVATAKLNIPENERASDGLMEIPLKVNNDKRSSDESILYVRWERSVETTRTAEDATKDNRIEKKTEIQIAPGPLGAKLMPAFGKIGVRIGSFSLGPDGEPGMLEKMGVKLGMYLREIDGDTAFGVLPFDAAIALLQKGRWNPRRMMLWSTKPSQETMKHAVISIFGGGSAEQRAINLIKARLRGRIQRKRDAMMKDPVSLAAREKWEQEQTMKKEETERISGHIIITVFQGHEVAVPRSFKKDFDSTLYVQAIAGERDTTWAQKVQYIQNNLEGRKEIYKPKGETNEVPKSPAPIWNSRIILNLDYFKKPEVDIRLVERSQFGMNTWDANPNPNQINVIGETTLVLPLGERNPEMVDGTATKTYLLNDEQSSLSLVWERPMEIDTQKETLEKVRARKPTKIRVTLPPGGVGCRFDAGFLGLGARIGGFSLLNGRRGPLEQTEVKRGMYLHKLDNTEVGTMKLRDVQNLIVQANSKHRVMIFSNRPSDECIAMAVASAFGTTRQKAENMLKKALLRKIASNRAKYDGVRIWVKIPEGPLSAMFHRTATKMGTYVSGFVRGPNGKPGQLEKTRVQKGMYLRAINNRDVSHWRYEMIMTLLKRHANKPKLLSFASKPGKKALKRAGMSAFSEAFKVEASLKGQWAKKVIPKISNADPKDNPLSFQNKKNKKTKKAKNRKNNTDAKEYWAIANFDYDPTEEGELCFKKGDRIRVFDKSDTDWWQGELHGAIGEFPANYTKLTSKEKKAPMKKSKAFDRGKPPEAWEWKIRLSPNEWPNCIMTVPINGFGAEIKSYKKGTPGPIRKAGVKIGSKLVSINGIDVSGLKFGLLMMLNYRYKTKTRDLVFSTRTTVRAHELSTLNATRAKKSRTKETINEEFELSAANFLSRIQSNTSSTAYIPLPIITEEITVQPGPLGVKLGRGINKIGTCIIEFVRPTKGPLKNIPLQLEASRRVKPGYFLTKIDETYTNTLSYMDIMLTLKARAKKQKTLTFSSQLSKQEKKTAIIGNAFGKSRLKMAIDKAKKETTEVSHGSN